MKRFMKASLLLAVVAVALSSCNCYKKMAKNVDEVETSCSPEVAMLRGKNAVVDVTVTFPEKYFNKKATWKITPVLVYDGGESVGTPKYIQGEKVADNYTVISKSEGGSYTQTVSIPYVDAASISVLELRVEAKCSTDAEFVSAATVVIGEGVRTTSKLVDNAGYMTLMKDNFKKVITYTEEADVLYDINRYNVRPVELTKEQIKLFEDFVTENSDKERTTLGNVYAKGYASPEGPLKFNDELSKKRSVSGKDAISKVLSDVDVNYDIASYGEDWEGFKELVQASNLKDKGLILQVLNMYSSPVERDEQIKNMTAVFDELKDSVLPALRRTKLIASADVAAKPDSELIAAATNDISSLTVEEALYVATLVDDSATKLALYKYAGETFNDARGYNNYAVIVADASNDWSAAKAALNKAATLSVDDAIANNLAAVAIQEGEWDKAAQYLSGLTSDDAISNQSMLKIAQGEFVTANIDGVNLAVAQLCQGNVAAAKSTVSSINNCPDAAYVKAVIAMREGNSSSAISYLKEAISLKAVCREWAQKDIEFVSISDTAEFKAL